ncbi:peptidase S1 [Actinosynnema sp. ALI-1.44]|uniref:trypsin-like serine protease n=1 Tax=Actinosynnema sp. ALI-1.44 TaxID=1933779 RepID=UPI00097C8223|nr:trypsin-like serine protease [Actinosynnema sp. ALI-1.44]ONI90997.1 peptidase S1 [Actinosynnema sp. ALI-1.44]
MRRPRLVAVVTLALATMTLPVMAPAGAAPIDETSIAATPTAELRPGGAGVRIVNGERTTVKEYPFVIAGMRVGGAGPQGQSCTASVVGKRKILTAAHCMVDATGAKSYIYGDDDLNTPGDETFRTAVTSFKTHPGYTGSGGWRTGNDVAVVTTADDLPVPENQWAKVAGSADGALTQPGKSGVSVGYGRTSSGGGSGELRRTTMPVNDANTCQVFDIRVNGELMVCTGYNDGRTANCSGDSGGPFIVDGVIVGVSSWGSSGCDRYSVMARLTNAMGDWARAEIGANPPGDGKFSMALTPSSGKVTPGKHVSTSVTTTAGDQGPEKLDLSASTLPAGTTATFQPSSTVNSGEVAKLTLETSASTPAGTHKVTITAKGVSGAKTAEFALTVGDGGTADGPKPSASPSSGTVPPGGYANATITVTGGTGSVRLSGTGLPNPPIFSPQTVKPGGTARMTIMGPYQRGTYKVTITATDSTGKTGTTEYTLTVR